MAGKFNHRRSCVLLAGLSVATFLTVGLLIVNGQGYYNSHAYNDHQAALDRADTARSYQEYQNSYGGYYYPYPYNDPQSALDLADIARANQMLYNYDSSDWEYWANLWLNGPYPAAYEGTKFIT